MTDFNQHNEKGHFTNKSYGHKKLRSLRLSDYAWDKLQAIAEANNLTRTDVIENFTRGDDEREIILKAIEQFIEFKKKNWGRSPSQKGEFNSYSRTWDVFNQFREFLEESE